MDRENHAARQTHIDNLWRMVAFCENKTDCRRALQLAYFGEHFDKQICKSMARTTCDNCSSSVSTLLKNRESFHYIEIVDSQVDYVEIDATDDCRAIAQAVDQLCGKAGKWSNNFTLTHFVDIFKGSESKKIVEAGTSILRNGTSQ